MANDAYDLDGTQSKVNMLRQILELRLDIATLRDLLARHNIISTLEFDAARKYISSLPEYKQVSEYLDSIESKVQGYKNDPQSYLRDLMNAKLNGHL